MKKITMKLIKTQFDFNNAPSGRVYDKDALEKAVNDYVNRHAEKNDLMLGEIYHDRDYDDIAIHLKDVTHKIKTIVNDDGIVSIEAELLDTPIGKVVQQMLDMGSSISVHPRMFGRTEDVVDEEGNVIGKETVIDKIISWDIDMKKE